MSGNTSKKKWNTKKSGGSSKDDSFLMIGIPSISSRRIQRLFMRQTWGVTSKLFLSGFRLAYQEERLTESGAEAS